MFEDLKNFVDFLFCQKKYKRIFFFENQFIEQHILSSIPKSYKRKKTLIISLYKNININNDEIKIIYFNKFFFLTLSFYLLKIPFCYSSTPDLNKSAFVKSVIPKTKYIYIQHSPLSLQMIYRDGAFNAFNLMQVVNKFQLEDLKEINKNKNLKIKYFKSRYTFMNSMENKKIPKTEKKKVLIAPTHSTNFYSAKCHLRLNESIDKNNYDLIFRPHFMSIKNSKITLEDLENNFKIHNGDLNFSEYDYLITDWSGIYIEFAFFKNTKSILINSSRKVLNDNFKSYSNKIIDIEARNILGETVDIENTESINQILHNLKNKKQENESIIKNFFEKNFY